MRQDNRIWKIVKGILKIGLCSLLAVVIFTSCENNKVKPASSKAAPEPTGVVRGFGISPQGFPLTYNKWGDFMKEVSGISNGGVMWNGCWRDSLNATGAIPQAPKVLMEQSSQFGFIPIFVFGFRSGKTLFLDHPRDKDNSWRNEKSREAFKKMLVDFAAAYKPKFVFIANENSALYEHHPDQYPDWLSFYNSAYDEIKSASPSTLVGTVFNFEHIAGCGRLPGFLVPYWEALTLHDPSKIDIYGITVYPFFSYSTPDEIPSDYLSPFFEKIGDKPIAITETGWQGDHAPNFNTIWKISEDEQVKYANKFPALISGRDVRIINWLFLYPMEDVTKGKTPNDEWKAFGSISLMNSKGEKRPVYSVWLDMISRITLKKN